ncbi:MAG TPA: hypothetical protein ENJ82_04175 [Bacteroidetes bacterium]|nr:hypothetical protein [Bacteroidota bacterium]
MILTLFLSGVFAQGQTLEVGQNLGSLIYLDGVNVLNQAEIDMKKDQLMLLETFDLMPSSNVTVRAKNGASRPFEGAYTTDANGAIHEILFFPKKRGKIKCTLTYTTKNGKNRKHHFTLKPAFLP